MTGPGPATFEIALWRPNGPDAATLSEDLDALAGILHAVVYDGAGVSFVVPFSIEEAREFWIEKVLPGVWEHTRRVLIARLDTQIVGTVQLELGTPPNQPHRAEVIKLLVHPTARRHGIARALMIALEEVARADRRSLLTLDTWTGSHAERLYQSLGYVTVGVIPRFARGSVTTELEPATIMYKEIGPNPINLRLP